MRYAILGAGGMGVQYGVLLQERAGRSVDFVDAWEPNIEAIRRRGGVIVSQDGRGRHLVPADVYRPEEYRGEPDVWIVFVKQHQLPGMLRRSAHLFRDGQAVFSAMNGYGHFERLAGHFAPELIYGGTALIGADTLGPGDFSFTGGEHAKAMSMCAYDGHGPEDDPVERAVFEDFRAATLNPSYAGDFMGMCLAKIVFNSVLNTLCTMHLIRFGEFAEHPDARWMTERLVDEAYTAAEAAGIALPGTRETETETILHTAGVAHPLHHPSMYQDLTQCRPTEVDAINGFLARLGREHGVACPLHEFLVRELHLAEHAYAVHHPEKAAAARAADAGFAIDITDDITDTIDADADPTRAALGEGTTRHVHVH